MSSVDERIVQMKIDNKQFLPGVKASQSALGNLNKAVDAAGKGRGMTQLGAATDSVKHKFSLLNAAALTAVATITNKLVNAGLHMVKSLAIDPIMQGYREYTTNLKAVQTIIANTGAKVGTVNKYLSELNRYSDQTIYNFSEMAKNIGTFTAAGVGLKEATSSIKGIANVAALSGSSAQQASGAMYQLSQAIAAGKVGAQDWNSVVNAGMAGKQLQSALARTAIAMGELDKNQVKGWKSGKALKINMASFKTSIMSLPGQQSWLTSGVLVKGLAALDGRFSKAALSQEKLANGTLKYKNAQEVEMAVRKNRLAMEKQGVKYSDEQFKQMMKMSDAAFKSAQTIKDAGQLVDVVRESIGSGWAAIFQNIFGNAKQASKLWTAVGNTITNAISTTFYKINSTLAGWRALGGYQDLWKGFGNIFKALGNIIRPFVDAIGSILPSTGKAGSGLYNLTHGFEQATAWFEKLTRGAAGLGPVFNIVAQVFTIVLHAIVGVVKYFAALVPLFSPLLSGVGSLAQDISEVVVQFLKMVDIGGKIDALFQHVIDGRQKALEPLITTVGKIVEALGALVHGDISGFKAQFQDALSFLAPYGTMVSGLMAKIQGGFDKIAAGGGPFGKIAQTIANAAEKVKTFATSVGDMFSAFKSGSADAAEASTTKMADATTKLSDGGSKMVAILKTMGSVIGTVASAIGKGIQFVWDKISNAVSNMDSIDLMSAISYIFSGYILLRVNSFVKSLQGFLDGFNFEGFGENVTGSFKELTNTLKVMQQGIKAKVILEIAVSVGILAGAMWVLSKIPAKQLGTGLAVISAMILELVGSMALLAKVGGKISLPIVASSLILMATSLVILAGAVAAFGNMDWDTLKKGFIAVGIGLALMVAASAGLAAAGPAVIVAAAAMVIMSVALTTLVGVILLYNKIKWGTLLDGIAKMGVVMLAMAVGMAALAAVGPMILVASAALGILSVTLTMMLGTILAFSKVSWGTLGKGVAMIAVALIAIGAAALLAAPGVAILGVGMLALGAGLLLAGTGMALFSAGLALMVGIGTAAFSVITTAIQVFLALLPTIAVQVAAAIVTWLQTMAAAAPKIGNAMVKIITVMLDTTNRLMPKIFHTFNIFLDNLLKSIQKNAPKFGKTFQVLLNTGLAVLRNSIPKMVNTGMAILEGLLRGISNRMPKIIDLAGDILVKFINGLSRNLERVTTAGTNLIIKFIDGLGKNGVKIADAAGRAIVKFLNGLNAAVQKYSPQINAAAQRLGVSVAQGIISGMGSMVNNVMGAAGNLASSAISAIHKHIKNPPFPSREGIKLGYSLAYGFTTGIVAGHKGAADASMRLGQRSIDAAKEILDIHSPSGVFKGLGINVAKGFVNGIIGSLNAVKAAGVTMAKDTIDMVTRTTTDLQLKADAQMAKADALRFAAQLTRQKLHNKKLTKAQKASINAQAKHLDNRAQAYANASASTQSSVDAVNKAEDDRVAFAQADAAGRADILNQRAQDAAKSAEAARQQAIKLQNEADLIRKKDAKRAKALAKQAQAALASSQRYAAAAQSNALAAQQYAVQVVLNSSSSVSSDLDSWLAQDAADKAYAAMTTEQQQAEMERRAAADQKKSDDLIASARAKLAQANALASTNAQAAQALVDAAAADVEAAKAAKDQADQEADQAKQLASDAAGGISTSTTTGGASASNASELAKALQMPDINIASDKVFAAQNMFDAYAKALAATVSAAAAEKSGGVTFVQNNTSPVALSPTEVYRQSKNLLSNAERKLAGALP